MLLTILLSAAIGAGTTKESLARDLVTIESDGSMSASTLQICKSGSSSKQYKFSAVAAPNTGMSRDRFVFIYGVMTTKLLEGQDCKAIGETIGELDGEFKISMNGTGMQISVSSGEQTERHSVTWDEFDD